MADEFTAVEFEAQAQRHLARLIERLAADQAQLSAPQESPDEAAGAEGPVAVAAAIAAARRLEADLRRVQPPQSLEKHGSRDG